MERSIKYYMKKIMLIFAGIFVFVVIVLSKLIIVKEIVNNNI